jgi:uncharacterized membrane protein
MPCARTTLGHLGPEVVWLMNNVNRATGGFRAALWGSAFLLICAAVPLLFGGSIAGWLVQSLPLALLIPGLRRQQRRSMQWLGFVTLFILVLGVLQAFMPDARYIAVGLCNVIGSLGVFGVVVYTARQKRGSSSTTPGSTS